MTVLDARDGYPAAANPICLRRNTPAGGRTRGPPGLTVPSSRIGSRTWTKIGTQWREREYGALRAVSHDGWKGVVDDLLVAADDPRKFEQARSRLKRAFKDTGRNTDRKLLLALYVYGRCLDEWEQTEDYSGIRTVIKALDLTAPPLHGAPANARAGAELLASIVSQAKLLDMEMAVEEAMNCSCPVAMAERSRLVVKDLEKLPDQDLPLGKGLAHLRAIVQFDAETSKLYYKEVRKVASAVEDLVRLNAADRARFDFGGVIAHVKAAEDKDSIKGDVYESELRAHRASLEAFRDRAKDPHLVIDEAELVYLYPFALEGIDAETVTETLVDVVVNELEDAQLPAQSTQELELNDLWKPHGGEAPEDGKTHVHRPRYSGVSIELPLISVETTAHRVHPRTYERLEFKVEVRLSRLGNHHVRVVSSLGSAEESASLHEVNQALRRGSLGMGAEKFTSEGRKDPWEKLPDYAKEVIETIARGLDRHMAAQYDFFYFLASKKSPKGISRGHHRTPIRPVSDVNHAVLTSRSISVERWYAKTPRPATLRDLQHAVGASLLFHPVRHLTTSLNEWIRYPSPTVANLLEGQGYEGDLVARTDNTTVTFMPATPEWLANEYEEMIEFVASIPPLLTLWDNKARDVAEEVDKVLEQVELDFLAEQEPLLTRLWRVARDSVLSVPRAVLRAVLRVSRGEDSDGSDPIRQLYENEMRIRELESEIGQQLAVLHSPALCRTRGQRQFLDNVWQAAGLPALERELERRLTALAQRQERIAVMVSSIDQDNRRKLERPLTIVIGLLAVASVAEVFSWINQAFGGDAPFVAWTVEIAILIAVAVLILFLYRYVFYRPRKPSR